MKIVLISTYELGRQPFGLASPAAWLREVGAEVVCLDTSRNQWNEDAVRHADLIAFYVPMHTATRLATVLLAPVQELNPRAHVCFYGLYASMNEEWLRRLGVQTILGGEFEEGLVHLASRLQQQRLSTIQEEPAVSLERQKFKVPDRAGLPLLSSYARLALPSGDKITVGYTEASRGCKHLCRHCPIVPVYNGAFRVIDRDVVLSDVRQQVAAGARHITFGDPDFFNGIGHAVPLLTKVHSEFPSVTYDVTIKVEHLLRHSGHLRTLRETGCLFVTSAVESVDDAILEKLDKCHTRADFLEVVRRFRQECLILQPTFLPFTPWTTLEGYLDLLDVLRQNDLIENVAPIQLAIRLLIPSGSRLFELQDIRDCIGPFEEKSLVYPWKHADPRVDALGEEIQRIVHSGESAKQTRCEIFTLIDEASRQAAGVRRRERNQPILAARATVPYLTEPWYC